MRIAFYGDLLFHRDVAGFRNHRLRACSHNVIIETLRRFGKRLTVFKYDDERTLQCVLAALDIFHRAGDFVQTHRFHGIVEAAVRNVTDAVFRRFDRFDYIARFRKRGNVLELAVFYF